MSGPVTTVQAATSVTPTTTPTTAAAATTTTTATATVPTLGSDAQTYTDPTYGYSFKYPAGWRLDDSTVFEATAGSSASNRIGAFDPDGAVADDIYIDIMAVSTYPLDFTLNDADIPAIESEIETVLAGLESQANNLRVVSPLALTEMASLSGYSITYTFDSEGVPATSTLYFLFKGNMEYQLSIQAATENWDKNQETFAAMLASFTAP